MQVYQNIYENNTALQPTKSETTTDLKFWLLQIKYSIGMGNGAGIKFASPWDFIMCGQVDALENMLKTID